eukprot:gene36440-biopygen5503
MSRAEVGEWTRNLEALRAVRSHLQSHGISDYEETLYGEYVTARASLRKWEEMFHAKFQPYRHLALGDIVHRSVSYTLHPSLVDHVMDVYHIRELPALRVPDRRSKDRVKAMGRATFTPFQLKPLGYVTPAVLNSRCNIFTNQGNSLTSQTVYSSFWEYFSSSDIALFQSTFGIPRHPVDHDVNRRDVPVVCEGMPGLCVESNTDLEYIMAIAQNTPTSIIYDNNMDDLVTWITNLANTHTHTDVYSIVYVWMESQLLGGSAASSFNTEVMKVCAMGVTIVAASGIDGAPGSHYRSSSTSDCGYDAVFPASSPYVTAVGSTMGIEVGSAEVT